MSVSSITARAQERTLSATRTVQEAVISVLKPFADVTGPLFESIRIPFADRLPSPSEAVEQWYGFAADTLAAQKDFSLSLIGLLPNGSSGEKAGATSGEKADVKSA